MSKTVKKAKYQEMEDRDGTILEAVFRVQEARNSKTCAKKGCVLGGRILPTMRYARVYYSDDETVECFHYACFREEFGDTKAF